MQKVLVLDVVSLTRQDLGPDTPSLNSVAQDGFVADMVPVLPAVTCPVQATVLTGRLPRDHGIVGNGWYFRDLAEVWLWRQSNALVQAPKVWELLRGAARQVTVAKLFWWYNMYSTATWSVTPRPHYTCDGRKFPGIYTEPPDLQVHLERELGPFPLFRFWGPEAGLPSTVWIVDCALQVLSKCKPGLLLVYLPHLDYDLQRFGPGSPEARKAVRELDREAGRLIEACRERNYKVLVLSEYAMNRVTGCVHINRVLRENGFVRVRRSLGWELLDCGASRAFAVSDHQVAHVYVRNEKDVEAVRKVLARLPGIAAVLGEEEKQQVGLDHERSGRLIALCEQERWFSYYWWLDDRNAPDFARTVDIHRKPGYDPLELFYSSTLRFPRARAARKALLSKLGFRVRFDLIGFETERIRGSHGLLNGAGPLPAVLCSDPALGGERFKATEVAGLIMRLLGFTPAAEP